MTGKSAEEVQNLLNTKIPEILWHYTSLAGAKGIIESDCLWATDIRFLNDTQEYIHAIELVELVAKEIEDANNREMVLECVRHAHSTGELSANSIQVFVLSFSEARDLLSQWRAYTEECRGVSLGFSLQTWRPRTGTDSMASLAPCIYDDKEKKRLVKAVLRHMLSEAERIQAELEKEAKQVMLETLNVSKEQFDALMSSRLETMRDACLKRLSSAKDAMMLDLLRIMPLLKHSSFAEEREWRLVLPYNASSVDDSIKRKIRTGRSSLVPYMEMPIGKASEKSLLTNIVVGPTPSLGRAIDSVRILAKWNNLDEVVVEASSTSFRSW